MKAIISGLAAMGLLGWFVTGGSGGPDASREVEKPVALVYSEMARLLPTGTREIQGMGRDGRHRRIVIDVKKSHDRAIDYRIKLDDVEVLTMALAFESTEDGAGTLVKGDLDVDPRLVHFAASQNGTEAKAMPGFAVDYAMSDMVEKMAKALEEGRPLTREMLFPLVNVAG
jgi:hypothetical protein